MGKFDLIVIGAGHAGIEAAWSASRLGCSVLLLTLDIEAIGKLSCNPAVGGVAKGNLVRETDALGGLIGRIADESAISYRYLNRSKGKAVWASRAQVDRFQYPRIARSYLQAQPNIRIFQARAKNILVKKNKIVGVETDFGAVFKAQAVAVCAGTFLKSTIHIGLNSFSGGRLNEQSSDDLYKSIDRIGIKQRHFKTGTCARLDARSLDFSRMQEQKPDFDVAPFSFRTRSLLLDQLSSFLTYTNPRTHRIVKKNLKYSPLYTGKIKSCGVRYCPSLEDKIVRFADKARHQVFIEPEGRNSVEIYPNGLSTSLPYQAQEEFIRSIEGLEKAVILRPGYGIEHGVIDARQLYSTLETKKISGLFFCGQVNGTTGYEEAAAQGCLAGINAALKIKRQKPLILDRAQAFIGVMVDDLTSRGVDEPYRMFTSRSELRLSVRESNADLRLAPLAGKLGLLDKNEYQLVLVKQAQVEAGIKKLSSAKVLVDGRKISAAEYLKRPELSYEDVVGPAEDETDILSARHEIEIAIKYEGFLRREQAWIKEMRNLDNVKLPKIDFSGVPSLSREVRDRLNRAKPENLGEASRISGITPAAILEIYHFLKRRAKP